ncbi:hypothetical protein T01_6553 [Trichinella spiralis]|uniref:Uncharacterized protein n=1 Tax=Trichinella spiralis TaxID=6334 RepID=A0A0V1AVP3_TRISP|nr:hypothetical protein T01_6553 [Trichinella spiralis]
MEKSESALTPAIDNSSAKIPLSSTTSVVKRDINQSLRSLKRSQVSIADSVATLPTLKKYIIYSFGRDVDVWIRFPDVISQLLNDIEEERTKYLEEAVRNIL